MKKILHSAFAQLGIFLVTMMFFPMVAFAATGGSCTAAPGAINIESSHTTIADVLNYGTCLIEKSVIPLLFAAATVVFLYGVVMFIKEQNAEQKEKGRQFMIWGVIAFTVMFGVWGLVGVLENTFGIANVVPQIPLVAS